MKYKKTYLVILIVVVLTTLFYGCAQKKDFYGFAFGTSYSLHLTEYQASKTSHMIRQALEQLEMRTSTQVVDSDIAKINASPPNTAIYVAEATFFILQCSKKLFIDTAGAYNPAIFPLVKLWNFDPENYSIAARAIPTAEQIAQTKAYCNFDYFILDESSRTVTKTIADAQLDLGASAKGYAADVAYNLIQKNGFIAIGGTIAVKGDTKRIAIKDPRASASPFAVFSLADGEFTSSSGDYERFYEYNNKRYNHIIGNDGYPAGHFMSNPPIATTVIANDGLVTDALSTAFMILPFAEVERLTTIYNCKGVVIYADKTFKTFGNFQFELTNNEYLQV